MELVSFKCPECGAPLTSEENRRWIFCTYCGAKIMLDDIEYYREDAKTERYKEYAATERHKADRNAEVNQAKEETKQLLYMIPVVILSILAMLILCILSNL